MASNSNINCCVPLCHQRGTVGPEGQKVGFFGFPSEVGLRKVWLTKIRRDPGKDFKLTDATKVCSLHFDSSEIKKGLGGKMSLKRRNEVFPTKFTWRTSPRKRPAPSPRTDAVVPHAKKRLIAETTTSTAQGQSQSDPDNRDPVSHARARAAASLDDLPSTAVSSNCEEVETIRTLGYSVNSELQMLQTEVLELRKQNVALKQDMDKASSEIDTLREQLAHLNNNNNNLNDKYSKLKTRVFCLENLSDEHSIPFYTGFPNIQAFEATFKYLKPGEKGENIRFWHSTDQGVDSSHYSDQQTTPQTKRGRPRALGPKEEFFMVMCRLRQALPEKHLGFLFGVSQSTISRVFISWINFMFLRFGIINIWPTREDVDREMPEDFKIKYPHTRVIIDCTEVKCQMPSSLLLNSELFSSYKNHTTLKGLVGISPSGAFTFLSQLYTGSISDRAIVERSGLLDLSFDDQDSVMADKGFTISDLLPLGVSLNIPPFLGQVGQMSAEDVVATQQIAGLRIHVERAINKIKNFHIWDRVIPISLFGVVNQMWAVCGFLCNVQDPILSE